MKLTSSWTRTKMLKQTLKAVTFIDLDKELDFVDIDDHANKGEIRNKFS